VTGLDDFTPTTTVVRPYNGNLYRSVPANYDYCPSYIPAQLQTAYRLNSLYEKGWDGIGQTALSL
jgi:hypothetical protein